MSPYFLSLVFALGEGAELLYSEIEVYNLAYLSVLIEDEENQ